ncbi:cupin domain-containing protein [Endogone sp. FLAS-F59071]|nr:cupin domain-containing protein [Endogone sp. FLAS-F59071]|eukprot:RUS21747.1 cupin domain-containing protein [Endogone sp. FLAS-F59071]
MKITSLFALPIITVSHDPIEKRVILKNGDVPHITQLACATIKPGQISSKHSHVDMTETFCFQSGVAEMEVDGNIFEVCSGTNVTVYPGEAHEIRNNGTEDVVVLYFGVV